MNKRIGMWLAAVLLAIAPSMALAGGPKEGLVAEPPSHVGEYLWLLELSAAPESPGVFDTRVFKIYYNQVTNRIVILGDDDGTKEIPTFSLDYTDPSTPGVLMIDLDGNLAATPSGSNLSPLVEVGVLSMPVRWPAAAARIGEITYTKAVINETAPDTVTLIDRAILDTTVAPMLLTYPTGDPAEGGGVRVDCSIGTDQVLFSLDTGEVFHVTDIIIRDSAGFLGTASMSFGWNAGACNDVAADANYPVSGGANSYAKAVLNPVMTRITGPGDFYVKFNTTQASRTVAIDVLGVLRSY